MEIQRYDMIAVTRCGEGWQELQREPEGEWMRHEDHLAALAAQQEEIDRLKAELAMVDEALARRPAVADSPNRYTSICAAFNMASRTEKAESMEKHWKFHFDRLEAENAKLQARLDAMSAPVSDAEMIAHAIHWIDVVQPKRRLPVLTDSQVNALLAARAKTEATK